MRKVCELFYAPVSGALPERQAEINDQAVDAIINFDAKTLKTLCETEGLDINKISMRQGLPEISASWLLFIFLSIAVDNGVKSAKEFIISPTKLPNFLKELQKWAAFSQKIIRAIAILTAIMSRTWFYAPSVFI